MFLTLKVMKQKRVFIGGKYAQNLDKNVMLLDAHSLQFFKKRIRHIGLDPYNCAHFFFESGRDK